MFLACLGARGVGRTLNLSAPRVCDVSARAQEGSDALINDMLALIDTYHRDTFTEAD